MGASAGRRPVGVPGPIEESVGFALARACRAYRGAVGEALAAFGMHPGQEMVMLRLWQEDGLGHSELAERVGVEPSTMSNMLARLERAGLVVRRREEADARSSRAYLTERGRGLRGPVEAAWAGIERRAFAGLPREERRLLRRALLGVRSNLLSDEAG